VYAAAGEVQAFSPKVPTLHSKHVNVLLVVKSVLVCVIDARALTENNTGGSNFKAVSKPRRYRTKHRITLSTEAVCKWLYQYCFARSFDGSPIATAAAAAQLQYRCLLLTQFGSKAAT
jgi:hypothetical protein